MFTVLLLASAAATAAPQTANVEINGSQLVKAVQNCQSIKDNNARLACYDKAASALVSATASGDVAIVDRNQVRQVRRSLFGFALPRIPFFSGSKNRDVETEPKELLATLGSFHPIGNGSFRFTSSNIGASSGRSLMWTQTPAWRLNGAPRTASGCGGPSQPAGR